MARRKRKSTRRHLIEILLMMLVLSPVTLYFTCSGCFSNVEIAIASSIFSGCYWVMLWKGNELGAQWLDYYFSWFDNPRKRLIISLLYTVIYTVAAVTLLHYLFFTLYLGRDFMETFVSNIVSNVKWAIIVTFIISTFMHGRGFLYAWRQTAVDVEKLRSEQLSSQYESLKSQVNPHFLFNSLNALTSLVHKDPDLSEQFIKQLSNVYRYVLDSQDKEVVNLDEELKFTEAFIFLQKIRYDESLQVSINLPEEVMKLQVPPLALQMLVENAIKHNIVSEAKPLKLEIGVDGDWLVVKNNLQTRSADEDSSGLGINNIKMRYEYLSSQTVKIDQTDDHFIARIPLLTLV